MLLLCFGVDRPIAYDSTGIGVGVLFASASDFGGFLVVRGEGDQEKREKRVDPHKIFSSLLELFGHEVYNRLV